MTNLTEYTPEYQVFLKEAAQLELPPLEGSEKQIAWAQDIRRQFLAFALEERSHKDPALPGIHGQEYLADFECYFDWLKSQNQAKWWIERRSRTTDRFFYRKWKQWIDASLTNKLPLGISFEDWENRTGHYSGL